jgi:hypothetical protein
MFVQVLQVLGIVLDVWSIIVLLHSLVNQESRKLQ